MFSCWYMYYTLFSWTFYVWIANNMKYPNVAPRAYNIFWDFWRVSSIEVTIFNLLEFQPNYSSPCIIDAKLFNQKIKLLDTVPTLLCTSNDTHLRYCLQLKLNQKFEILELSVEAFDFNWIRLLLSTCQFIQKSNQIK